MLDSSSAMTLIMYILRSIGADPGFQVRGAEGGTKIIFFPILGGGGPHAGCISPGSTPVTSIQKLINIDHQKLVEICLKEIIDRFIWTIELCHI